MRKYRTEIRDNLEHVFGVSLENATDEQCYKAVALSVRDRMEQTYHTFTDKAERAGTKHVYYLCMEFLMGRSLKNSLFNLGLEERYRKALAGMGLKLDSLYEQEPDAGLGNGGLGRLAACFMDSLATLGYPATGYSLRYEYGIFRQKLVDGWQTELPDFWLPGGKIWLRGEPEKKVEVRFNGHIEESWNNQYHLVNHKDFTKVIAVPYDMYVAGYGGKACQPPAPLVGDERGVRHEPVQRRQLYARHGAEGDGGGHHQGAVPGRQSSGGQKPAPFAAVFSRFGHDSGYHPPPSVFAQNA